MEAVAAGGQLALVIFLFLFCHTNFSRDSRNSRGDSYPGSILYLAL